MSMRPNCCWRDGIGLPASSMMMIRIGGGLSGAHQRDCGEVFDALWLKEWQSLGAVPGEFSEFVRLPEDGVTEVGGRAGGEGFYEGCRTLDAKVVPVVAGF